MNKKQSYWGAYTQKKTVIWVIIIVICLQVEREKLSIFAKWKVGIEKADDNLPENPP